MSQAMEDTVVEMKYDAQKAPLGEQLQEFVVNELMIMKWSVY